MKNRLITQMFLVLIVILTASFQYVKKNECNYVPDEVTAIKIAEAILVPIYGEEVLNKKPYKAILVGNKFWRVEGSIGLDELGGIPIIEIQKSDCKILKVTHTK